MTRPAYLSMELIGWFVIVPFRFAALLSGLVVSPGTRWGLFRHWWILAKFVLTVVAERLERWEEPSGRVKLRNAGPNSIDVLDRVLEGLVHD